MTEKQIEAISELAVIFIFYTVVIIVGIFIPEEYGENYLFFISGLIITSSIGMIVLYVKKVEIQGDLSRFNIKYGLNYFWNTIIWIKHILKH